ncbi:MAG: Hsp20/alpha crystallin family protein [Longimicrobiales bacterium]
MIPTRRTGQAGLDDVFTLQDRMNQLLDIWGGRPGDGGTLLAPPVNVREDDDNLYVEVEVPGVTPDDIEISLENGMLRISGEKKQTRTDESGDYHIFERRYGRFERSFSLARRFDPDRITARYDDGVLRITLPKTEEARPRRIRIGGAGKQEERQGQEVGR